MRTLRHLVFGVGASLLGGACIDLSGYAGPPVIDQDDSAVVVPAQDAAGDVSAPRDAAEASDAGSVDAEGQDSGARYPPTVMADRPLAYFRLDESSGTTAVDSSGFGNSAPYSSGTTFGALGAIAHDPDTATSFDGVGACISMSGNFGSISARNPLTLEAWIRPTMLDSIYRMIFSKGTFDANGQQSILLFVRGGDSLGFQRYVNDTLEQILVPPPTLNVYSHVVATYDGAQLALYVNGIQVGTAADTRSLPVVGAPLYIGCGGVNSRGFAGVIDEAAVYDKALSGAVIAAHYQAGAGL